MSSTVRKKKSNGRKTGPGSRRGARKKARVRTPAPEELEAGLFAESLSVVLGFVGLFSALALYSLLFANGPLDVTEDQNLMGALGGQLAEMLSVLLGWTSFSIAIISLQLAYAIWPRHEEKNVYKRVFKIFPRLLGTAVITTALSLALALSLGEEGGGILGAKIAFHTVPYLNDAGSYLISFIGMVFGLGLILGPRLYRALFRVSNKIIRIYAAQLLLFISYFKDVCKNGAFGIFRLSKNTVLFVLKGLSFVLGLPGRLVRIVALTFRGRGGLEEGHRAESLIESREFDEDVGPDLFEDLYEEDINDLAAPKISRRSLADLKEKRKNRRAPQVAKRQVALDKYKDYQLPSLDLLVSGDKAFSAGPQDDELVKNARRLEKALSDFRIGGKIVEVHPGPIITLYEFSPASGIKVQSIVNLSDDLALALKVARVRVYAPVPGKGTVGIEVPNAEREIVRLRDVLSSKEFLSAQSSLELALGKDTFGDPYVADLARMPHLLIAGATGTGKSVCINSLLMSLLYRNSPEQLRLILIDPKMLELSVYERIPHLKCPVVTNPRHARGVLHWAVEEMERRYQLMKGLGVRSLESYNKTVREQLGVTANKRNPLNKGGVVELEEKDVVAVSGREDGGLERSEIAGGRRKVINDQLEHLPQIVIVVDELADLMLTVGREIEELLTRLAQKARAAGIHLILATQRPSVNVITGLIKANFPTRISFQVASRIDSRTILDTSGSEKLLGQGDMLLLPPGTGHLKRLHSAFVSDKEVNDVVHAICQQGSPDYDPQIAETIERLSESEKSGLRPDSDEEYDAFYDQAIALVAEKGQASTSMIQRAFRIGYNRAARILETMEAEGVVGPADGSRPRKVLLPKHETG